MFAKTASASDILGCQLMRQSQDAAFTAHERWWEGGCLITFPHLSAAPTPTPRWRSRIKSCGQSVMYKESAARMPDTSLL